LSAMLHRVASAMIMPMPFLPEDTTNQKGINCPGSEKFRGIFARVLPPQHPQRCPQALCPDKLTLPTALLTHVSSLTREASLLRALPRSEELTGVGSSNASRKPWGWLQERAAGSGVRSQPR